MCSLVSSVSLDCVDCSILQQNESMQSGLLLLCLSVGRQAWFSNISHQINVCVSIFYLGNRDGSHLSQLNDIGSAAILRLSLQRNRESESSLISPSLEQMKPETKTRIES